MSKKTPNAARRPASTAPSTKRPHVAAPPAAAPTETAASIPRRSGAPNNPAKAATAQTTSGLKVRALSTGYYDHVRRREGDVFLIAKERDFSERWMEYVDPLTPEKVTTGAEELRRTHDEIMLSRRPGVMTTGDNPLGA